MFFVTKNYKAYERYEKIAFDIAYFMNGSVQYNYLLNEIDILDFVELHKMVIKLSKEQARQAKKA